MADEVDTPFSGPMTMQDALSTVDNLIDQIKEPETEEAAPEPDEEEAEAQAEAETHDETEADEPGPEDEGPQLLTVEEYGDVLIDLDGEATPLSELVKGNLRQADYTRKRQADADEARSKTTELEKREKALEAREQQLQQLLAETEPEEPDWEALAEEDPLGVTTKRIRWEKEQKKREAARMEQQQRQEAKLQEVRAKTAQEALKVFPEWSEDGKFDEFAEDRRATALAMGFTREEYDITQDFRVAALLEKARLYDAMQSEKSARVVKTEKRISKAPKVLKPGQSRAEADPADERRAARRKLLSKPTTTADLARMLGR